MSGFAWHAALAGLGAIALLAFLAWTVSVRKNDVSIVDSLWSVLILAAGLTYAWQASPAGPRTTFVLVLLALWTVRLAGYITWRNWGEEEDRRYQEIRARNQPGFVFKSLYLVFGLQGVLAWIVSASILAAIASLETPGFLDALGAVLVIAGLAWETVADAQLARFRARADSKGKVLDTGLWRYSRHPNYFGECVVWWGFYVVAVGAGGWWAIVSPVLMTILLLRVSGVSLLEQDIGERRPGYQDYVERTSAFVPWPPRPKAHP